MCITGNESPVVVVPTGSMEPGFKRGDILLLRVSKDPIQAGEIIVSNVDGCDIPIVHHVIEVNNDVDDRSLYAHGQLWLQRNHIMGRAAGFLSSIGWLTIILIVTEKPIIKYILISAMGLLFIASKD